jgi:hypothetical protein
VFLFVLAISEVNAFLALRYFTFAKGTIPGCPTLIVVHRQLAWQLVRNIWIVSEESAAGTESVPSVHTLMTSPNHAKLTVIGSGHAPRWQGFSSTSAHMVVR